MDAGAVGLVLCSGVIGVAMASVQVRAAPRIRLRVSERLLAHGRTWFVCSRRLLLLSRLALRSWRGWGMGVLQWWWWRSSGCRSRSRSRRRVAGLCRLRKGYSGYREIWHWVSTGGLQVYARRRLLLTLTPFSLVNAVEGDVLVLLGQPNQGKDNIELVPTQLGASTGGQHNLEDLGLGVGGNPTVC